MKIKVILSTKTKFPSYWTPVTIDEKLEDGSVNPQQHKTLTVKFSKEADKLLPVDFKGGQLVVKGSDVVFPYVYEVKTKDDGTPDYPFVFIKNFDKILPLPEAKQNTCHFDGDEEETEETEIK